MIGGRVEVKVPASTANLGPGFDVIGMAFQLYTTITMELADKTTIRLQGDKLEGLPTDKSNLVYKVAAMVFERAGLPDPDLAIEMQSEVPLTRGLGSSAAAIVGALIAANELAGSPFSREELYLMSSQLEGHPDNVGASLFGGIVVAFIEEEQVPFVRLPVPKHLEALAVIPNFMLSTEKAREVLPSMYGRKDLIYTAGHAGVLIAALAAGNLNLLQAAMQDVVHQPYRMKLVPGLEEILRDAHHYGALGTALSGAGPTIIALIDNRSDNDPLHKFMVQTLAAHQIDSTVLHLIPDEVGVIVNSLRGATGQRS
ncbi:homoserine kinase [Aneurinibacillus sp. Ricciae_BoGa-3]|uniref:homoserine kinase n=1 Tax=Aneurinibacillus sp. Ricciae_BoGa-3 TaxID=3022697 RepID=UPI0023407BAE|nr:homoserine kinase [Aneurinibacillus sp. Ricciae_BoGa-3]WCK53627.1 homoserine kinase [Aneurinibacillus sp. Ricciae_BoGa-3]